MFVWTRRRLPVRKYDGAVVIEPKRGFYDKPIATLDFASLYPSIIRQHKLCPTNFVWDHDVASVRALPRQGDLKAFEVCDAALQPVRTHHFVQRQDGIVPKILDILTLERKRAKAAMAAAKGKGDSALAEMEDGRQLALKITANSLYGFFGAQLNGLAPFLPISETTTSEGRKMLYKTKELVEVWYPPTALDPEGTIVVYGDTDSVMVKFCGVTADWAGVEWAFKCMYEAAKRVSAHFGGVISLEGEKVYWPYYLMRKKRYMAIKFEKCDPKQGVEDVKGFDTKRRDTVEFVANVLVSMIKSLLHDRSPQRAIDVLKDLLRQLVANTLPLEQFVMSKSLKSSYSNAEHQVQAVVNEKVKRRTPGKEKKPGDRVEYVIVEGDARSRARANASGALYDRGEDPDFVKASNGAVKIDRLYYLEKCLKRPVHDLLGPLLDPDTCNVENDAGDDDDDDNHGGSGRQSSLDSFLTDESGGGGATTTTTTTTSLKRSASGSKPKNTFPNTDKLITDACRALYQQRNGLQDIGAMFGGGGGGEDNDVGEILAAAAASVAAGGGGGGAKKVRTAPPPPSSSQSRGRKVTVPNISTKSIGDFF